MWKKKKTEVKLSESGIAAKPTFSVSDPPAKAGCLSDRAETHVPSSQDRAQRRHDTTDCCQELTEHIEEKVFLRK